MQFIQAASKLFFTKGYNATSVKDILEAVGDNTSSPSVFYYYFKSKDEIYQAALANFTEEYLIEIDRCAQTHHDRSDLTLSRLLPLFLAVLATDFHTEEAGQSLSNRFFMLYLRNKVTQRFKAIWEQYISALPWLSANRQRRRSLAAFIAGGIGEIASDYFFTQKNERDSLADILDCIVDFCADTLKAPEELRTDFRRQINGND